MVCDLTRDDGVTLHCRWPKTGFSGDCVGARDGLLGEGAEDPILTAVVSRGASANFSGGKDAEDW
jgi:hypothetical protein